MANVGLEREIIDFMNPMIEVQNVKYRYEDGDGSQVLEGVSLSVEQGEFVAILGHNGSGKSTLAKLLNALYIPTEGRVLVCGMDTADEENTFSIRQNAGMVFQNPDNQLVATIVEEDIAFGLENLGLEPHEIRERVDNALATVGMSAYAQSAPHMLSGGQKQRIAIAGVVAMQPRIIILDEPTAMLDPSGRKEVMQTVLRLNREMGITVVYITHFMEEAAQARRIVVMDGGTIAMQGPPRDVFSHVEQLKRIGLDVPWATELAYRLKEDGLNVNAKVLTAEELTEELCRLL